MIKHLVLLVAASLLLIHPAHAVKPHEILDDPVLEERARDISKGLRCLVCQNESIDDSNARLASDMRILVRERLVAGDSDEAVVQYLVDRYGDYVLLTPPVKPNTYALWAAPVVIFLAGAMVAFFVLRGRARALDEAEAQADTAGLSEEERARLDALKQ